MLLLINSALADVKPDTQNDNSDTKYTFYVGPLLSYVSISGDFNGKTELFDAATKAANQITVLPVINSALGYGVLAGVMSENISLELTYTSSSHSAYRTFIYRNTKKTNAEINMLSIDAKYYLIENSMALPYLQFGLSFPWLLVSETTTKNELTSTDYERIRFSGIGLNLGGGIMFDIHYVYLNINLYLRSFEFYQTRTDTKTNYQYFPVSGINLIPSISVLYKF
jgi:opacity protein-like surface antigen